MDLMQKYQKNFAVLTCMSIMLCLGGYVISADVTMNNGSIQVQLNKVYDEYGNELEIEDSSFVGGFLTMIIGVLVASYLINSSFAQINELETSSNLDTNEQDLVGTWGILIIVAVIGYIVGGMVL